MRAGLVVSFVYYGLRKVTGAAADVAIYDAIGFGQWPRPITGSVELFAAALLCVPGLTGMGATLLVGTMITGTSALVLFTDLPFWHLPLLGALSALLAWHHRNDLARIARLDRNRHEA